LATTFYKRIFMTDLCPSISEVRKIIEKVQRGNSEFPNIDFKGTLNLKEDGDCATFIHHIAAIANTGQKGYLYIGIEDKTWKKIGIDANSPLRIVDTTQQQMNQILSRRLDPSLTVGYRLYDIDGFTIGVVGLDGKKSPYIVSLDELPRFGGGKTKGKENYIYNGVIYFRRGTDSIPVNKQSKLFEVLNGKRDYFEITMSLIFIGVLISIGVGIGASQIRFSDVYIATLLGGSLGIIVGFLLNKRLADAFGKYPIGIVGKIIKNAGGLIWGGIMGMLLSYIVINEILLGKIKPLDPFSMGLILGPILALFISITLLIYVLLANDIWGKIRRSK